MHSLGAYANDVRQSAPHDAGARASWSTGSVTGLDNVDMWIGGLAEKQNLFGGLLGSTFEFIFRTQMESPAGRRPAVLPAAHRRHPLRDRVAGQLASPQLIRTNTGIKHLPGNIFLTPEYTVEASDYFLKDADGNFQLDANGHRIATDPSTWLHNPVTGALLVEVLDRRHRALHRRRQLPRQHHRAGRHRGQRQADWPARPTTTRSGATAATTSSTAAAATTSCSAARQRHHHRRPGRRHHPWRRRQRHHLRRRRHRHHLRRRRQRLHRRRPRRSTTSLGGLGNDIIIGGEGFDELHRQRGRRLDREPRRPGRPDVRRLRRADRPDAALQRQRRDDRRRGRRRQS